MIFTKLWNNKTLIINNYLDIISSCLPNLITILIIFGLIVIYAYMRNKGFKLHQSTIIITEGFSNTQQKNINQNKTDSTTQKQNIKPQPPATLFLTVEEQRRIKHIINDTYLSQFNQPNIQARGFDTREELTRTYNKCLIPITEREKEYIWNKICKFIDVIIDDKRKQYINSWLPKIQIAKGAPWLEAGMPHTHDNCIIMRPDWFSDAIQMTTFIHELTHVTQRINPSPWHDLYFKWGFVYATELSGMESYLTRYRVNPDGMDNNWVWHTNNDNKYYWIGALYNSVTPKSLTDVSYVAIPLTKTGSGNTFKYIGTTPVQISKLKQYQSYFNINENHYHPNEIAAQYAEYFFNTERVSDRYMMKYPGYALFDAWMSEHINK